MKYRMILYFSVLLALAGNVDAEDGSYLHDTGQAQCYSIDGKVITCPNMEQSLFGQDASYQKVSMRYEDNNDGTIADKNTGLIWRKKTADTNNDDSIDFSDKVPWWGAKDYCSTSSFGGYQDWRLPTIFELLSIVDYGKNEKPPINPILEVKDNYYWSITSSVGEAWELGPNGGSGLYLKSRLVYARCVRGTVRGGNGPFVKNNDGTITDQGTALVWQQTTADTNGDQSNDYGDKVTWQEALLYCEKLSFADRTDWRLPDIRELISIVDYTRSDLAIDPVFEALNSAYWSSTTCSLPFGQPGGPRYTYRSTKDAWNVWFMQGNDEWDDKSSASYLVRCVRGGLKGKNVPIINHLLLLLLD